MLDNYKDVITVNDLCHILLIRKNTAYKLLQSQTIPNKRIGSRKYIIPKNGVVKYLNSCM